MKVTKAKIAALTGVFACCVAATLLLTFAGRGDENPQEEATYFYTNYASAEALMAASIENATGEVVIVAVGDAAYISGAYDAQADSEQIQSFFEQVFRLPLQGLVEGASASDEQYGLTQPKAEIMLEDVNEDGLIFRIGKETPDGEGYYTCLVGDDRVFQMGKEYAELFLDDVGRFYDLSLLPNLDMQHLQTIAVRQGEKLVYQLEQVAASENGAVFYYALTEPFRLLIGTQQLSEEILTPLSSLSGVNMLPAAEDLSQYGLDAASPVLTLSYDDGTAVSLQLGREEDGFTYVRSQESGMVVTVPSESVAFAYGTAQDIVGNTLLSLNMNVITDISVNDTHYVVQEQGVQVSGSSEISEEEFRRNVLEPLNGISIQGSYSGEEQPGELRLEIMIQTNLNNEKVSLQFYQLEGRRCAIYVDGQPAFWCSQTPVDALGSFAA